MIINSKDAPQWVQDAIKTHLDKKNAQIYVNIGTQVKLAGNIYDYCRTVVVIECAGEQKTMESSYYDSLMNATKEEKAIYQGGNLTLQPDCMILEMVTPPHPHATLWVHPINWNKMIAPPATDLSPREKAILVTIRTLISSARQEDFRRFRVTQEEFDILFDKGYIDRRRSITLKGKNAIEGTHSVNYEDWRK
jgi:hypothetical protein